MLVIALAVVEVAAPTWPATFSANFTSPPYPGGKGTSGFFAYDSAADAELKTFQDGTHDHLCSAYHNATPCTHLTVAGWYYLVFPERDACCKCCSFDEGCGPLRPNWLSNSTGNLQYLGLAAVVGPAGRHMCDKWEVRGLAHPPFTNYYYAHASGPHRGLPCEIDGYNYLRSPDQRADDLYLFGTPSTVAPADSFRIPGRCAAAARCGTPVCSNVQAKTMRKGPYRRSETVL
jgi:hypothetical protein